MTRQGFVDLNGEDAFFSGRLGVVCRRMITFAGNVMQVNRELHFLKNQCNLEKAKHWTKQIKKKQWLYR